MEIHYSCGKMVIDLDEFFPCTAPVLRKLHKIIRLDWEHEDELCNSVIDYCTNRIEDLEFVAKEVRMIKQLKSNRKLMMQLSGRHE